MTRFAHALRRGLPALLALAACLPAQASVEAKDDRGQIVRLARPAARIVSLSPHATELLFAAGAGAHVVGTVEYSDYPDDARRIPRVGDNRALDLERLVALKPDLIVLWWHGNSDRQIEAVRALGIPLFHSEPRTLEEIASSLERLGVLTGSDEHARAAAAAFRRDIAALTERYSRRAPVSVFYQVWDRPLMTLNGDHLVSKVITLCGGRNVFAGLQPLVPTVSREDVLERDPEAFLTAAAGATAAGQAHGPKSDAFAQWRAFPRLKAVARGNLFAVNGDWLNRATPRIALGARELCEALETARTRRPAR